MKSKQIIIMSILVLFCYSLSVGFALAEQVEVTVSNAQGSNGSTIEVPIMIRNADDVGSMDIVMTYDPTILEVDSITKGDLNQGMISSDTDTSGILSIAIADQDGITGDGEISIVSFTVMNETGSSPLVLEEVYVYDINGLEIDASAQGGTFTVTKLESDPKAESPGFELMVLLLGIICIILIFRGRKK